MKFPSEKELAKMRKKLERAEGSVVSLRDLPTIRNLPARAQNKMQGSCKNCRGR